MATSAAALDVRDALNRDEFAVTRVLAAAFAGSRLGAWLAPDPDVRERQGFEYVGGLVRRSLGSGLCRVALEGDEIVGAALWSVHSPLGQLPNETNIESLQDTMPAEIRRRRAGLDGFADARRPQGVAYQQLTFLGVQPSRQGQGIGGYLLIGHHAFLHLIDTPAFAVVVDGHTQRLFERHGYTAIGPDSALGGVPVRAMWRPPQLADPR